MNRKRKKNGKPSASDTPVMMTDTASRMRVNLQRLVVPPP